MRVKLKFFKGDSVTPCGQFHVEGHTAKVLYRNIERAMRDFRAKYANVCTEDDTVLFMYTRPDKEHKPIKWIK